jgi:type III pantothenate kinase
LGNAYLGGVICPGVSSSAQALALRTAKLPLTSLEVSETEPSFGQDTATSLNHGFVFGFAAMTEGMLMRLKAKLKTEVKVIATGGFAQDLSRVVTCFDEVVPDLLMEGLLALSRRD